MGIWSGILLIIVVVFVYLMALTKLKINHIKSRSISKKIKAEVIRYQLEHNYPVDDIVSRYYPYVKIEFEDNEYVVERLEYGKGHNVSFKKGEVIDVFWNGGKLYYWNEYDSGIFKLLPSKWRF
ncbi:hypothetical protein [Cellulophaga omnivescoria]|uniref:hypothetical protein n=1 Tax=Cellulophaga omnivescoria TaxID=1888890 RepID=UPI003EBF1875